MRCVRLPRLQDVLRLEVQRLQDRVGGLDLAMGELQTLVLNESHRAHCVQSGMETPDNAETLRPEGLQERVPDEEDAAFRRVDLPLRRGEVEDVGASNRRARGDVVVVPKDTIE